MHRIRFQSCLPLLPSLFSLLYSIYLSFVSLFIFIFTSYIYIQIYYLPLKLKGRVFLFCFVLYVCGVCGSRNQTQGLTHYRQALH